MYPCLEFTYWARFARPRGTGGMGDVSPKGIYPPFFI